MNKRDQYFFDVQQKICAYAQAVKDGRSKEATMLHREVASLTSPLCAALLRDGFDDPSTWCGKCDRRVPLGTDCPRCAYDAMHQ